MFNLITAIITILLVILAAVAGIYFGGSAFSSGTVTGQVATYNTQALQIDGAVKLYEQDNSGAIPATVNDLVPNYLVAVPPGSWTFINDYVVNSGVSYESCLAADQSVGLTAVPTCSSATQTTPCCSQ